MSEWISHADRAAARSRAVVAPYLACLALVFVSAACSGGSPQMTAIYTPIPRPDVFTEVLAKVKEMGYTIVKEDAETGHVLGQRPSGVAGEKDEIDVWIGLAPET